MNENPKRLTPEETQATFDRSPYISTLGLEVVAMDHEGGEITVRMPIQPSFERAAGSGQFHGGPIAAFIDVVGDFAIGMALGGGVPTINIRIDYLKPAFGQSITGVARVRRHGRTVAVVDIDVSDEKGSLVAVGRGTYSSQRG